MKYNSVGRIIAVASESTVAVAQFSAIIYAKMCNRNYPPGTVVLLKGTDEILLKAKPGIF